MSLVSEIPLLGPKLDTMQPAQWKTYVNSLRSIHMARWRKKKELAKLRSAKPPAKPYGFRRNDKGTPIVTIRNRKPKWVTRQEFKDLLSLSDLSERELWNLLVSKKIEIRGELK